MNQRGDTNDAADGSELWLGYADLLVPFAEISALLVYQPAWDRRIVAAYGSVPADIRAVVLLHDGQTLPARRALDDLKARWAAWQDDSSTPDTIPHDDKDDHDAAPAS